LLFVVFALVVVVVVVVLLFVFVFRRGPCARLSRRESQPRVSFSRDLGRVGRLALCLAPEVREELGLPRRRLLGLCPAPERQEVQEGLGLPLAVPVVGLLVPPGRGVLPWPPACPSAGPTPSARSRLR